MSGPTARPPPSRPTAAAGHAAAGHAHAAHAARRIYDEESDRHVHIKFLDALDATCYGHKNGPRGDLFGLSKLDGSLDSKLADESKTTNWKPLGEAIVKAESGSDAELKAINAVVTKIKNDVTAGKWVPVELVVARPFIEHLMLSAIVTVSGRDTGATLFGPAGTLLHHALAISLLVKELTRLSPHCFLVHRHADLG